MGQHRSLIREDGPPWPLIERRVFRHVAMYWPLRDTWWIANDLGVDEAVVANALARIRDEARWIG